MPRPKPDRAAADRRALTRLARFMERHGRCPLYGQGIVVDGSYIFCATTNHKYVFTWTLPHAYRKKKGG